MPTYDYRCEACGHEMEEFQSITAKPLKKCPACGKQKLQRLIGIGAGIIFKGSGFYETDYRSDSYKQAAKADKEGSSTPAGSGDGKPESKPSDGGSSTKSDTATTPAPKAESSPAKPTAKAGKPPKGGKSADK